MAAPADFDGFLNVRVDYGAFGAAARTDSNWDGNIVEPALGSGGGWFNPLTGLGTFNRDKVMAGRFGEPIRIPDPELAAMFNGNALCRRIVTTSPRDMMRLGYTVCLPSATGDQNDNAEVAAGIENSLTYLKANEKLLEALIYGGLFGGGLLFIGADDGKDPSQPLDEQNIKSIRYISFLDRRWLTALTYYGDPFAEKYGEVETYNVTNIFGAGIATVVHESRCLRVEGAGVDLLKRRALAGWTYSVLQAPYDSLRQFASSEQGISNLLTDLAQAYVKINGLMQLITNDERTLVERMRWMDLMRSSGRMILLDAENEEFGRVATPLNGVADTWSMQMLCVSMAAELPQTILFGRSPQGMNATGDSDFRMHYDRVDFRRANELGPMLMRLIRLICLAKDGPTNGVDPMVVPIMPRPKTTVGVSAQGTPQAKPGNPGAKRVDGSDPDETGSPPDASPDPVGYGAPKNVGRVPAIRTVKDEKGVLKKSVQGGVEIEWPKLWVPSEKERAEIYFNMAQADSLYVTSGTLLPAEVALARFRNGQLNVETTIDVIAAKAALDQQRENVKKGLPPVATPGSGNGPNTDKPDDPGQKPPAKKAS